jgi:hypothetical protein
LASAGQALAEKLTPLEQAHKDWSVPPPTDVIDIPIRLRSASTTIAIGDRSGSRHSSAPHR